MTNMTNMMGKVGMGETVEVMGMTWMAVNRSQSRCRVVVHRSQFRFRVVVHRSQFRFRIVVHRSQSRRQVGVVGMAWVVVNHSEFR